MDVACYMKSAASMWLATYKQQTAVVSSCNALTQLIELLLPGRLLGQGQDQEAECGGGESSEEGFEHDERRQRQLSSDDAELVDMRAAERAAPQRAAQQQRKYAGRCHRC